MPRSTILRPARRRPQLLLLGGQRIGKSTLAKLYQRLTGRLPERKPK